jgi:hypothetical protein
MYFHLGIYTQVEANILDSAERNFDSDSLHQPLALPSLRV